MTRVVAVVEDDADLRESYAEYLEAQGFTVVQAENGVEALEQIRSWRPTSLVLDLLMPRLGGLETLRRAKAFDPSIRVVVVTGAKDPAFRRRALALGASIVLEKPVALDTLLAALNEASPSDPAMVLAPVMGQPGRVLIVDDEADVRGLLQDFLSQKGYHVTSVADGATALLQLSNQSPDLVLLDVDMPRLSGIETLAAIQTRAPHVKVIMISGKASLETAKKALAYGALDYISKPFDLDHLNDVVSAAFIWDKPAAP